MKRYDTLQALRGLAAVSVMVMHCMNNQGGLTAASSDPLFYHITKILNGGCGAGVDVFFVISGFVIITVALRASADRGRIAASAAFMLRRILRVYPLYWVTLAAALGLAAWFGFRGSELERGWSLPVVMLASDQIPFLEPAWTLAFEMWFYLGTAFLIILLPRRYFLAGVAVWAAGQALMLLLPASGSVITSFYAFNQPQLLDFFLGCGVAGLLYGRSESHRLFPSIALVVSPVLFAIGYARCFNQLPSGSLDHWERLLFYGLPACLVLYALLVMERQRKIRTPSLLRHLGDWSYSIYLWHYPVMSLVFVLTSWYSAFRIGSPLARAAFNAVLTLMIAPLSFRLIEKPFINLASARPGAWFRGRPNVVNTEVK